MKAVDYVNKAAELVGGDRAKTYGDIYALHSRIAGMWSAYLGYEITPLDVALMCALMKVARTKAGSGTPDNFVDLAGYAGVAGEIFSHEGT